MKHGINGKAIAIDKEDELVIKDENEKRTRLKQAEYRYEYENKKEG